MTDLVSGMSDKVLHLYVEVRAVGEDRGKELLGVDHGRGHRMLHGPDVLPHSHRGLVHSLDHSQRGLVHSPDVSHRGLVHSPDVSHRVLVHSPDHSHRGLAHSPDVSHRGLAHSPDVSHTGLAHSPDVSHRGLAHSPDVSHRGLAHFPDVSHRGLVHSPDVSHKGLVHSLEHSQRGLVHSPDVSHRGFVHSLDHSHRGLLHSPDISHKGLLHSPDHSQKGILHSPNHSNRGLVHSPDHSYRGLVHSLDHSNRDHSDRGLVHITDHSNRGLVHSPDHSYRGLVHSLDHSNRGLVHTPDLSHRGLAHSLDHYHRGLIHSPDHSPVTPHRSRALSQSLPLSRRSSRHTVNFQLPVQPHNTAPSAAATHQDARYGSLGQLLDVLSAGTDHHSHLKDRGFHSEWVLEPPSPAAGRLSVPTTPTSSRRFYEGCGPDTEHGKTSVVRFGYVEKANVNTGSQHSLLHHYETDNPFCETKDNLHLRKRNSDPGWHRETQPHNDPFFTNYHPMHQLQGAPAHHKRSSLKAVGKDATHRALEEFGSPELKRRFENYCQNNNSPIPAQHYHSSSSSKSPILRHKSPPLPSRSPHSEVTRDQACTRVTASHTPDQYTSPAASPSLSSQRFPPNHRQQWMENEHCKTNMRPHLPAGRPTDIQHIISMSNFPASTQTHGNTYQSEISGSPYNLKHLPHSSPQVRNMTSPEHDTTLGRRTFYNGNSSQHLQTDYQSPKMYHRKSQTLSGYGSPLSSSSKSLSLPGSLNHNDLYHQPEMQSSNISDSRKECPQENFEYHQSTERRDYQQVCERSPTSSPKICTAGPQNTSMTRTSSHEKDQSCAHTFYSEGKEEQPAKKTPPSVEKVQKSGVGTQASHVLKVPGSRSEKIAKAKWEFLYGAPSEEWHCSKGSTSAAPSRPPTGPCARGPRDSVGQRLVHHKVQQIEVELFTPDPAGSSSGIIRRTLKYSETDLDAVPLRCYHETDLDQVMQAEAEVFEDNEAEVDSAFGSDRSILGPENGQGKQRGPQREEERVGPQREEERGKQQGFRPSREMVGPLEPSPESHSCLKSPVSLSSPRCSSDTNLDSFSRHFESIMESHRAKGTSYSSLDSVDVLTSGSTSVFTFDLPTLTPEIQTQISETARHLMDLSFASLSCPLAPRPADTTSSDGGPSASHTSQDCPSVRGQSMREKSSTQKDGFKKVNSAPSLHSSLREHVKRPLDLLYPQADVAERLARADSLDPLNGIKADQQAAKRLARRLYSLDGFKKSDVARHLSKNNEFSHAVAEEYLKHFDFTGLTIDQALRLLLRRFALVGETQERERVLTHFSRRYRQCNPHCLNTEDSVHTLTCAVMLLNSDLHGHNVGKRMSCSQFISNLEGLNSGKDFPKELLKTLYTSIRSEKLQWTIDEEEEKKSTLTPDARKDSASHTMKRLGPSGNPLVSMAQQAKDQVYKSGFLVRKVHSDQNGKRTPRGKRGWKAFYGTLKGLVLYLQKEEYRSGQELTQEDLKNAVSIHHCLAMRAADYSKRAHVFYLRTADWRVFLFQAPSAEQMQSWITRINVVSAMFSAPPFPPAIGSQKRFSRPLLPGSSTKLSQEEQLKSHENRFRAVSSELAELTDSKVKGGDVEELRLRQEYLEFEKTRYGTYSMLLRAKLQSATEDLSAFESRLLKEAAEGGLHRAHSSPALPQYTSVKDRPGNSRSKSLKLTSSSHTKEESHNNGDKPDNNDHETPP